MIVFYHNRDLDGLCSGAILHRRFPSAKLIGIDYGDPFPWYLVDADQDKKVIMADFSLQPFSDMEKLANRCELVWCDHHKTALADFTDLQNRLGKCPFSRDSRFDVSMAGCELSWLYAWGSTVADPVLAIPKAVKLLGQYDIWNKKGQYDWDKEVMPFQYGMKAQMPAPDDKYWDLFLSSDSGSAFAAINFTTSNGRVIQNFLGTDNRFTMEKLSFEACLTIPNDLTEPEPVMLRDVIKAATDTPLRPGRQFSCLCLNKSPCSSQTFESRWDPEKYQLMVAFCWTGTFWTVSLYSTRDDIDCSAIAKAFGGGGHFSASGFQWREPKLPLIPM